MKEKHSNKGALTSSAHPELRLFVKSDVIWILFTLPLVNIQSQLLSCPVPPMPAVFLLFFFLQLLTYAEKSAILSDAMAVSLSFTTSWGTFLVVCVIVYCAAH